MKYFGLSCIISLLVTALAYAKGGWELAAEANAWPGGILLVLAAILSGTLVSGDRSRANFHSSPTEELRARTQWSWDRVRKLDSVFGGNHRIFHNKIGISLLWPSFTGMKAFCRCGSVDEAESMHTSVTEYGDESMCRQ
ncbi:DUF5316 domain-containing protein [Paenibacillus melissococcoides]|uniref:DUF5316 domain-containing protein n=1 Tax=Paenibacillus melissococcoides TaxID=2912268 RepID=A0ABN8U676_9BACL|nr:MULTISPECIES: DUF5316 family protein [Paenibacillus]MEB9895476.1 DUF5316 family protein [Bacillus cereus]CAH8246536.1 DUF5316 domain-containing protein [Paenibacillus melissococcoides]CAH8715040.1 DUF5316 domain-containing protein [Paenibacillus melissococcoides]CAH8715993.1 DUF5316 domain-containing protein [Paenibacillus melissococcoides]